MHQPVMLTEVLAWLQPRAGAVYMDGTVGEGGHSTAILEACSPSGRLVGFDRDAEALGAAERALQPYGERAMLIHARYREAASVLPKIGLCRLDGILLALGVSSRQLDAAARCFSFQPQRPLALRLATRETTTPAALVHPHP